VGSKTFDGVWFISYMRDHLPPHVHGEYAETTVVVDLLPDGTVRRSRRWDSVEPANAKRSDIRRILEVAAAHAAELMQLWEKTHGPAS
jgi:hypothetical protein